MTTTLPDLRRLHYFHGQLLSANDFRDEQSYFRERLKLHNRCLHGFGVVCGLRIEPLDDTPDPGPKGQTDRPGVRPRVKLTSGVALDCLGNEIVVPFGCELDLLKELEPRERERFEDGASLCVSIEYCDRPVLPTRGVYTDSCGNGSDCQYGWHKDDFKLRVTLAAREEGQAKAEGGPAPEARYRCAEPYSDGCDDPCCTECKDPRLLLARIDDVRRDRPVRRPQIHMEVRRPVSRYHHTAITGINWVHDGSYTVEEAKQALGTRPGEGGLVVRFSRPVLANTLVNGVVQIQVIEGGPGRSAYDYFMTSEVLRTPGEQYTDELRFRHTSRESLEDGDQVLITVRTAFILDRCCRPVDGTHVGGRVPRLDGTYAKPLDDCPVPPSGIPPWTSGTGVGGDVFESWFYIKEQGAAT